MIGYFSKRDALFEEVHYATLLESSSGELLSAQIADDGQWRFPIHDSVPRKYSECIRLYEDEHFYKHPGVNPFSTLRALFQNLKAGRVVSGGSTITMQLVRMNGQPNSRSIWQKLKEMIIALRVNWHYSKEEIIKLHSAHAPFGGNVVGLEAACWRYFNRQPHQLSWAEYAMLAVLPNAPSLIHPGKNREKLLEKRNRLLNKLQEKGAISEQQLELALLEPLPEAPYPLPQRAVHLLQSNTENGRKGLRLQTSLDGHLQDRATQILHRYVNRYAANSITAGAVLIADIESGEVLAYVGNAQLEEGAENGYWNDMVKAERSTGSILKPFLYAAMMHEGQILPNSYVEDVPTFISGYAPKNYSHDYAGMVPASQALARSLNVPAVRMLRDYSYQKFHSKLRDLGMKTLTKPPSHYGLSIILGGAEGRLWDLCGMYASLGRILQHFPEDNARYRPGDIHPLKTQKQTQVQNQRMLHASVLSYVELSIAASGLNQKQNQKQNGALSVAEGQTPLMDTLRLRSVAQTAIRNQNLRGRLSGVEAPQTSTKNSKQETQNSKLTNHGELSSVAYNQNLLGLLSAVEAPQTSTKNSKPETLNSKLTNHSELRAAPIWQMFKAMREVHRPDENQAGWRNFESDRTIAWKTGTSFGYRDAWAIGVDGKHVVGVWIGNADGTGRDDLVGVKKAAPVMFDLFNILPPADWFTRPHDDYMPLKTCAQSGLPASQHCNEVDTGEVPYAELQLLPCPYHKTVHLDQSGHYQVTNDCISITEMQSTSWFVLPPVQEYYFRKTHPWYRKLPPMRGDCLDAKEREPLMSFIYPENFSKVKIPRELDGQLGKVVLRLAHRRPNSRVFWYLDKTFIAETRDVHDHAISPEPGAHELTVVDETGESLSIRLVVVD